MMADDKIAGMLFGTAAGDALGVPVEFAGRAKRKADPVRGMRAFGSHMQEAGTWSDDASLTFCTAEAMLDGYSPSKLGAYFLRWLHHDFWTARGKVFDIGIATREALYRLADGTDPLLAGGVHEHSNGNGSLMRIAPLAWFPVRDDFAFFQLAKDATSITHRHERSVLACHLFLCQLKLLMQGRSPAEALQSIRSSWPDFIRKHQPAAKAELQHFSKVLDPGFANLPEDAIESGGYVMHSLEASIWCLLNTSNFKDAVLMAVNLGDDTDTTAAICGAMAGTYYGYHSIPLEWMAALARTDEIENLARRFSLTFGIHDNPAGHH